MTGPADRGSPTVLVFSDQASVREQVRRALGRRPAPELGPVTYLECETGEQVVARVDAGGIDVAVFDGEAQPTGGMGLCRQLKYEIEDCPAICVLIGRRDDRWLATWSLADAVLSRPLDPVTAADTVAGLLRARAAGLPVAR